jgi:hypothetical protein
MDCKHTLRIDGVCKDCGKCFHQIQINGLCDDCGKCFHRVLLDSVCIKCGIRPQLGAGDDDTIRKGDEGPGGSD